MGRTVPTRWQQARKSLQQTSAAYLSLERVLDICRERNMDEEETRLFVRIAYGRALLEHIGNDVRITVRTPYPERFLFVLTHEVKWLVESFWASPRCDVMVLCVEPCVKLPPCSPYAEENLARVNGLLYDAHERILDYVSRCDVWCYVSCSETFFRSFICGGAP